MSTIVFVLNVSTNMSTMSIKRDCYGHVYKCIWREGGRALLNETKSSSHWFPTMSKHVHRNPQVETTHKLLLGSSNWNSLALCLRKWRFHLVKIPAEITCPA